jgi:hypothetical protein
MSDNPNKQKTERTQAAIDTEKTINIIAAIDTDPRAGIQTCTQKEIDSASKELKESKVTATSVGTGQTPTPPTASAQEQNRGPDQGHGRG